MDIPEPQIVEFLHPVEIQVDDFESFLQELKKIAGSQRAADKNVLIDLGELSAVPKAYVKLMLKAHKLFQKRGRSVVIRATPDLRRALRNSIYGKTLQFERGGKTDAAGYEIRGNRLIFHDTSAAWFETDLIDLLLSLEATQADPAILDLSELESVSDLELRRTAHAALQAQLQGQPVRLHALETHARRIEKLGLDKLLDTRILDMKSDSGMFPTVGGKVDPVRLEALIAQRTELPETVKNQQYQELGTGSYRALVAYTDEPDVNSNFEESEDGLPIYVGPNHRKTGRFSVADALLDVHKKRGGEIDHSELVDLSESGSQIFSEVEMFVGEKVTLTLDIPDFIGEMKVIGKVVWVQPLEDDTRYGFNVGVRFIRIPAGSMLRLRRLEGLQAAE